MTAYDGNVNKPGVWEGLYNNKEKEILMVKYYGFDRT